MRIPQNIIKRPLLTEKSTGCARPAATTTSSARARSTPRRSSSRSPWRPTRSTIRDAVEKLFNVQVTDVHTLIMRGKEKRVGRFTGRRPSRKKAIVTLQAGDRRSSSSRESEAMAIQRVQADLARPARNVQPGLRVDHQEASPEKKLLDKKNSSGGRNNYGRITIALPRRRPQAALPHHRLQAATRPACRPRSCGIEYDPNRSARIALLQLRRRREDLHPRAGQAGGRRRPSSPPTPPTSSPATACRCATSRSAPRSTRSSSRSARGAQLGRSAGASVTLMAKEGDWATLRLPSGEMRKVHVDCRATVGVVGNSEHANIEWGKAGRTAGWASARTTAASP